MTDKPEALRLADECDEGMVDFAEVAAELRRLQGLVDDCAIYLKEGETPAERIAREHRDTTALMELLAREKRKSEALLVALQDMVSDHMKLSEATLQVSRAAMANAEAATLRFVRSAIAKAEPAT